MLELLLKVLLRVYFFPKLLTNRISNKIKARRCVLKTGAKLYPESRIDNHRSKEDIIIGERSVILAKLVTMGHGGKIEIGSFCFIGENSNIWSASHIKIGNRVLISHDVNIHDTISHSFSAKQRHEHFLAIFSGGHPKQLPNVPSKPITIGDDVWIGFGATVLKGVTVGEGAVIGACTLVTKDIPPYSIVIGSPAEVVGSSQP